MNRRSSQTPPERASELFEKLLATSDNALKTRERLFAHLKEELELLANLQEQHLFPILRKHRMQDLVNREVNDNQETTALLTEIADMPKDRADFRDKVAELQKAFQQHIREDKKELLPAVLKLLSDEEAEAVADQVKNQVASTDETGRGEVRERREQDETAPRVIQHRGDTVRTGAEAARAPASAAEESVESSFAGLSEPARRSTDRTFHMLSLPEGAAFGMTDQAAQSFQVVARSSAMLASAIQDIARVWLELSQGRWHANFDGFGQLTRCRSTADFLTIQSFLIRSNLEQILDSSRRIAQIAVQAADRAAETLTVEVEKTIRRDKGPT